MAVHACLFQRFSGPSSRKEKVSFVLNSKSQSARLEFGRRRSPLSAAAYAADLRVSHRLPISTKKGRTLDSHATPWSDAFSNPSTGFPKSARASSREPVDRGENGFSLADIHCRTALPGAALSPRHGIGNWGWTIIVFTAIFNILTFWPRILSMKSSLKMMCIQPKIDALKRRYAHLKISDRSGSR